MSTRRTDEASSDQPRRRGAHFAPEAEVDTPAVEPAPATKDETAANESASQEAAAPPSAPAPPEASAHQRHRHHHEPFADLPGDDLPTRRRKRKRRRLVARVVCIVVALLVVIGAGTALALNHFVNQGRRSFEETTSKAAVTGDPAVEFEGKRYELNPNMATVAFIGFDNRASDDGSETGQSDTVMVLALNTDTGKATGIVIPRDSMVAVDTYANGSFAGQVTQQLCMQFAYGADGNDSSRLTTEAASRVLYDIPIDYYFTLNIAGVADLNDAIGGVSLTPTQTVPKAGVTEGVPTTLYGRAAEYYVQWRDTSQLNSSLDRQQRQVSYLNAFVSQLLASAKGNPASLVSLYQAAQEYTWTNLGLEEFTYLASTMLGKGVSSLDIVTLDGEMTQGERYAEFHLDRDSVYRTVLQTFYHEVGDAQTSTAATDAGGEAPAPEG